MNTAQLTPQNVDRIIAKQDSLGNKVIFCSDTMRENSITMWRPNASPVDVSLDYYHASKPIADKEAHELAEQYVETWGHPIQLMQRLPRVLREKPKFKMGSTLRRATDKNHSKETKLTQAAQSIKEITAKMKDTPASQEQGYIMRKAGDFWKVMNTDGTTIAYTVMEDDALKVLKDLMGNKKDYVQ